MQKKASLSILLEGGTRDLALILHWYSTHTGFKCTVHLFGVKKGRLIETREEEVRIKLNPIPPHHYMPPPEAATLPLSLKC